ncbi:MAG: hypothetical protein Q9160_008911 [Pyrenula sp. 1 TL-2023]
MTTPAWITEIERNHPNNTWIHDLKRNNDLRIKAYRESKETQYLPAICEVCRSVDFEYLFFGAADKGGFRQSESTHVFFGSLTDVKRRATKLGCPFCRDVLLSEAVRVKEKHAHEIHRMRKYGDIEFSGLKDDLHVDVWVEANDLEASRDPIQDLTHGVLYVRLVPTVISSSTALAVITPGSLLEDDENGIVQERVIGKAFSSCGTGTLHLIDHSLSRALSLGDSPSLLSCRSWFETCCKEHNTCSQKKPSDGKERTSGNKAFKLIDLILRQIIEVGDATGLTYATLSYVCGRSDTLWKLPQASQLWTFDPNYRVRKHPLPVAPPKTISDAMVVASNLGLRYLWVDSFCIAQDDPDELQRQIRAMHQIYTGASICIVACSGVDSHSGLPGVSSPRRLNHGCQVKIKEGLTIGFPQPSLRELLDQYKWMNRAWTYQELILSRRCLLFTESEIFFYCASSTSRESHLGPKHEQWARSDSLDALLIGNANVMNNNAASLKAGVPHNTYIAAVDEYSRRELSYQTDGLNAFQGLSTLLGQLIGTEMIYGCPKNMLVNCLTWQRADITLADHPERRMLARPEDSRNNDMHLRPLFPSWAWVAWKGHVKFWPIRSPVFWSSEMQIMDPSLLPPIPVPSSMQCSFMTSNTDETQTSPQPPLSGLLPTLTKHATLRLSPHPTLPFILTIHSPSLTDAGSESWAGEISLDSPSINHSDLHLQNNHSFGRCIQLFAQPNKDEEWGGGAVCVMLIKTFQLPSKEEVKQSLLTAGALRTAEPLTTERVKREAGEISRRSKEGPEETRVVVGADRGEPGGEMPDLLLASRMGIGFCKLNAWREAELRDRVVLLG